MALEVGSRLGVFEVTGRLGEGGMGVVYRATDTTLHRDVALKVLPDAFAEDAERLARFQREAQVLASLNHPNIAQIHGLEQSGGTRALVLELVEGPTLQDRISQGPIPLDEALPIARQIAEALEAAHEQGIIHRDLKPANVKVKDDGTVKVLDFGLAKALEPDLSEIEAANSPTMTMTAAATRAGFIMGTAAYMAPEQAKGRQVDKRADIWAFGVVLFEMLTGKQTFGGTDISETLAAVLRKEMDWTALPVETPASVRRMLRRCVTRDRKNRLADMSMARLDIDDAGAEAVPVAPTTAVGRPALWQRPLPLTVAALSISIMSGLLVWSLTGPPTTRPVVRYSVTLPESDVISSGDGVALSPDGERLVYASSRDGVQQLFLRARDRSEIVPLRGTEGAVFPFFSPDGEWVGFFTGDALKKISLSGGPAVTLCEAGRRYGATWGPDETVVFSSGAAPGLMRVSANGGVPTALTTPEAGEDHVWPAFVPGGQAIVFTVSVGNTIAEKRVAALSLETGEWQVLADGTSPRVSASGHLVFGREASLWAMPFNVERLTVSGEPTPVLEGLQVNPGQNWAHYALADDGSLAYLPAGSLLSSGLVTVNRSGQVAPLTDDPRGFGEPRYSPQGDQIAVEVDGDIWIFDIVRGTLTRLTVEGADQPVWTSEGLRIAYRGPGGALYWRAADGSDEAAQLASGDASKLPTSWSADDEVLAFVSNDDLWVLPRGGDPTEFLATSFDETRPEFSPDGRWLAYISNASGRPEVYVQPYPGPGGRVQISTDGGREPGWAPNGGELFYRDPAGDLMVVPVETGPTLTVGQPQQIVANGGQYRTSGGGSRYYDIAPDGERVVMVILSGARTRSEIDVVLNWLEELNEQVPVP